MPVLSFRHPSGRDVHLDSLSISRVYGGVLEGRPSVKMMLDSHLQRLTRQWGPRATVVLLDVENLKDDRLPEYIIAAWMNSYEPVRDGFGSEIVVVWFSEDGHISLPDNLISVITDVDWENKASDWEP